jgi:AhpD family alkylhydroperoxidase
MATVSLVQYDNASPEVRAVYDDIKTNRKVPDVNNFWKALANHPALLKETWERLRDTMAPGALDAATKEMIYLAVSIANACEYCIHTHTASAFRKGMSQEQYLELLAVVGLASANNALASALQVPVDKQFLKGEE